MTHLRGTAGRTLAEVVDGVLFDLDGVVYRGPDAVEHAPEAINALTIPAGFVTNNAGRTPEDIAQHLQTFGVDARPESVTTSAQAAAGYVAETYGLSTKVLMVGGIGLRQALQGAGLTLVSTAEEADVVVQGSSRDITWPDLAEAVYAINNGAIHIATNLDSTMPTERGMALGNGALVAAVRHATGGELAHAAGKPEPQIFQHAAKQGAMSRPLVVGDRLDTDIGGAVSAQMAGLVVLTGVTSGRDVLNCVPSQRPDYLALDLRGLHQHHPEVSTSDSRWACEEAGAGWEGPDLWVETGGDRRVLSGAGTPVGVSLNELRAACHAAWSSATPVEVSREIHIRQ